MSSNTSDTATRSVPARVRRRALWACLCTAVLALVGLGVVFSSPANALNGNGDASAGEGTSCVNGHVVYSGWFENDSTYSGGPGYEETGVTMTVGSMSDGPYDIAIGASHDFTIDTGTATITPQTVVFTYGPGGGEFDFAPYPGEIVNCGVQSSASTPPVGEVGLAYSATPVSASSGTLPYTFSATGLPPGLTIDPSTGSIDGDPTVSGNPSATITVTDAHGATSMQTVPFTIYAQLSATTTALPTKVDADTSYTQFSVASSGGAGGLTYSLVKNSQTTAGISVHPNGSLSIDIPMNNVDEVTGRVFQYRVTDSLGATATSTVQLVIDPGPVYFRCLGTTSVQTADCASHNINDGYGAAVHGQAYGPVILKVGRGWSAAPTPTTGGDRFTLVKGTVPPGMTLTMTGGYLGKQYCVLSGTPSKAGTYTFYVRVNDQRSGTMTTYLTVKVS